MPEERNQNQIIRIDARNCFVESLNDSFGFGKAHFTFASYDLSKPSGQRQTNSIQIYIDIAELLELCRKLAGGELRYMMQNAGIVLSREKLEQHVWDYGYSGGSNVIDVYIRYLRKKLDQGHPVKYIHTVRGAGYVLKEGEG